MDNGERRCIAFGGLRVDDAIEDALLTVVGPGAIAAAVAAEKQAGQRRDQVLDALKRDLEAARYAADRAFRQYDAIDPANRLVAGELETRWNQALARLSEVEGKVAAHNETVPADVPDPVSLAMLASDLKAVWAAPSTDARLKKRIVRTVIQEVVADIDPEAAEIMLVVHWTGGVHSEMRLPRRRRGQRNSTSADVIAAVRQLVLIATDDVIAGILNRNGLVTGHGNRWTRERVTSLRSHHRISVHKPAEDAQTGGRGRRGRDDPPLARRSLDLCPRQTRNPRSSIHHRTGAANLKISRGITSRPTIPLTFNNIDRWVFWCAVVIVDPPREPGAQL